MYFISRGSVKPIQTYTLCEQKVTDKKPHTAPRQQLITRHDSHIPTRDVGLLVAPVNN